MTEVRGVRIAGVSAVVPHQRSLNRDLVDDEVFSETSIIEVEASTGIKCRHIAPDGITASDLCWRAAERIIQELEVDRADIGCVIFVTQSPDYRVPSTAPSIATRLGLETTVASFDVNLACSGYVYGLWIAAGLMKSMRKRYSLLLAGETMSKLVSPRDRATTPLFGDAGTATLLELAGDAGPLFFDLNSDGAGAEAIYTRVGGARRPHPVKRDSELDPTVDHSEFMEMDGLEVFNFTLREVPKSLKRMLNFLGDQGLNPSGIVLHQANKMIMDHILKRVKFSFEWAPQSLGEFGNTSSASIPLTVCYGDSSRDGSRVTQIILAGYGAGLSWGTAYASFANTRVLPVELWS